MTFFLFLATAVLGVALWIDHAEGQKLALMERRVRDLISEIEHWEVSRSPLSGQAVAGNAWDDYLRAMKAAPTTPSSVQVMSDFCHDKPNADRAAVEGLVTSHLSVIADLQKGARKSMAHLPYDWEEPYAARAPRVDQFRVQQVNFLIWSQARLCFEAGRVRKSIELLLDQALFGRDAWMSPDPGGEGCARASISIALLELERIVSSGTLQKEDLGFLDQSLAALDQDFPERTSSLLSDAANLGMTLLREEHQGGIMHTGPENRSLRQWRWMFSSRLRVVDTFLHAERWARRAVEAERLPWKEATGVFDEIESEREKWKEPIVRWNLYSINLGSSGGAADVRKLRARVRLLRIAAHFLATGDFLELDDPFGEKILRSVTGGGLKVWSVGRNGQDDSRPERAGVAFKDDIVLEVGPRQTYRRR